MNSSLRTRKTIGIAAIVLAGMVALALVVSATALLRAAVANPFDVSANDLSSTQRKVVTLLEQEYKAQPAGAKYTEGANEPWCADFASWIMREAGIAYTGGPESDWRLELVEPITQYYKDQGRFRTASDGYQPQVGDVVMYKDPSPYGNHINIVIKNENGLITSVGGNEGDEIQVSTYRPADDPNLVGYGILP